MITEKNNIQTPGFPGLAYVLNENEALIAGYNFGGENLWTDDSGASGTFSGLNRTQDTDTKVFFAGADDKTGDNATFYVLPGGQIFHDAIGGDVTIRAAFSDFGAVSTDVQFNDEWSRSAGTGSGGGSQRNTAVIGKIRYRHRFGINTLRMKGYAKRTFSGTGVGGAESFVRLRVGGSQNQATITNSSYTEFTITRDVSILNVGQLYEIQIELEAYITATGSSSIQTFLREDFIIEKLT